MTVRWALSLMLSLLLDIIAFVLLFLCGVLVYSLLGVDVEQVHTRAAQRGVASRWNDVHLTCVLVAFIECHHRSISSSTIIVVVGACSGQASWACCVCSARIDVDSSCSCSRMPPVCRIDSSHVFFATVVIRSLVIDCRVGRLCLGGSFAHEAYALPSLVVALIVSQMLMPLIAAGLELLVIMMSISFRCCLLFPGSHIAWLLCVF
jgi:hypothetical protein